MDLKRLREDYGVSQVELARKTGISQATLSRIEAGERAISGGEAKLIEIAITGRPESQPEISGEKPSGTTHKASLGVRRAFVCIHATKGVEDCRRRVFLQNEPASFIPDCPEHGPMVRQANHPYFGQSTEPTEDQGWPPAIDRVKERDEAMARYKAKYGG